MCSLNYHYSPGDSIEGLRTKAQARSFFTGSPVNEPRLGGVLHRYTFDRNAEIFITRCLEAGMPRLSETSYTGLGDGLEGKKIRVLTKKGIKSDRVGPGSASHNVVFYRTHAYTYAKIQLEYSSIPGQLPNARSGSDFAC